MKESGHGLIQFIPSQNLPGGIEEIMKMLLRTVSALAQISTRYLPDTNQKQY
jgi:hypothetical protein